jgi:glucose-6-phosphate-specific signal transduction histidine kinase
MSPSTSTSVPRRPSRRCLLHRRRGAREDRQHANADQVDIAIRRDGDELIVEVVDDGEGSATRTATVSAALRAVEALDGTLVVTSPAGGPTT